MSNVPSPAAVASHEVALRIERVAIDHPDAQRLIEEVQQFYVSLYGGRDDSPIEPGYFDPPMGSFFVGYLGDEAVATGAWRFRPDVGAELGIEVPAEIKRMYVVPRAQGRGLARTMLAHLERTARAAGARTMILETGAPQVAAIGLYTASGYERIESFGHYRWSDTNRCFARPLG
ncbi:MAG: GNAT family N-acetyltransferase [Nocardioides sp.]|nr:GNAT family N-acetyltransferase [Nocardioides sp.]